MLDLPLGLTYRRPVRHGLASTVMDDGRGDLLLDAAVRPPVPGHPAIISEPARTWDEASRPGAPDVSP